MAQAAEGMAAPDEELNTLDFLVFDEDDVSQLMRLAR